MARDDWEYIPVKKPLADKIKRVIMENKNIQEKGIIKPTHLVEYVLVRYFEENEI